MDHGDSLGRSGPAGPGHGSCSDPDQWLRIGAWAIYNVSSLSHIRLIIAIVILLDNPMLVRSVLTCVYTLNTVV